MRERRTYGSVRGLRREPLVYSTNITDDDIIPFYPIDIFEIASDPIKEIILGSKNNIFKRDFELYAAKHNMKNIVLRFREISFRR